MTSRFGFIIFFFLANVIFFLTNLNMCYMWRGAPPNTYYPFVHGGHADYYLYLSTIRESKEGAWTTPALFTSEPASRSFWYIYFIALGKMAAIFSISPVAAYHLGRFISIEYLIVSIYFVCKVVLGRHLAFWGALAGFFSTVPPLMLFPSIFPPQVIPSYWVSFDPSGRMDYLPHHAFGIANLFATLSCLFTYLKEKKQKYLYLGLFGSFAQGLLFPPAALAITVGFPLSLGIYLFHTRVSRVLPLACPKLRFKGDLFTVANLSPKKPNEASFGIPSLASPALGCIMRNLYHKLIRKAVSRFNRADEARVVAPFVFGVLLTLITLLIMRHEASKGFPWSQWQAWDVGLWNDLGPVNQHIILAGGLTLLISLPAVLAILTQGVRLELIFVAVWAILPYLLLPFTNMIGISRIRVAYMGNFVPLGILSVLTVKMLGETLKKKINLKVFYGVIFALFLFLSLPVTIYYLRARINYVPVGFVNLHIPVSVVKSMDYMAKNTKPYSVVLGMDYIGNMLPAFIRVKSYYGHVTQTRDYGAKTPVVEKFYSGKMTPTEALDFIRNGKIDYIYTGPIERSLGGDLGKYNLPTYEVYNQEGIVIYKMR